MFLKQQQQQQHMTTTEKKFVTIKINNKNELISFSYNHAIKNAKNEELEKKG